MKEKYRRLSKEEAILLALKENMALVRRELEVYGLKVDGKSEFICKGKNYDT